MRYDTVLFDLDGTLVDSFDGVANSLLYALEKLDFTVPDREWLRRFLGPPLWDSFREFCGFDEETVQEAVALYRERYNQMGLQETTLFDGTEQMLKALHEAGLRLAVASAKPDVYVQALMAQFSLTKYFTCIAGSTMDRSRIYKPQIVQGVLEELSPCHAVMVGDRKFDAEGAAANGLDFLAVCYHPSYEAELLAQNPVCIAYQPHEVSDFLLKT